MKFSKKHSRVHSGKDSRKSLRKQTCKRARKERLDEWIGIKAVGVGIGSLRIGVNIYRHNGCPSRGGHQLSRVSAVKCGS